MKEIIRTYRFEVTEDVLQEAKEMFEDMNDIYDSVEDAVRAIAEDAWYEWGWDCIEEEER